ncbi:MAG: hypothetical protein JOZ22_25505 [Acidobacteriia bacterium]|nr:hypothetical protein [Terriglobia bacterium]
MVKKIGIASLALAGVLVLGSAKANAAVRFGIGVGVAPAVPVAPVAPAVPVNPYAYPYADPAYVAPYTYAYPYVGPSIDFGFGYGGWHGYHAGPIYRGGEHFDRGFHGGFHREGRR